MAGNLKFIKSATSATTVSSLEVTDCFSADYDIYKVYITKIDITSLDWIAWTYLDSGGSEVTSSLYDEAVYEMKSYQAYGEGNTVNGTRHLRGVRGSSGATDFAGFELTIFNPYSSSSYTFAKTQSSAYSLNNVGMFGSKGIFVLKQSATHTGIKVFPSSASMDNVTIKVFGIK
jgi:hypothetical protein